MSINEMKTIRCPECGNNTDFSEPEIKFLIPVWLTVGVPSLYRAHLKKSSVQCLKCKHIFPMLSIPQAPLSKFANIVLSIMIFTAMSALILSNFPELLNKIPENIIFDAVESFIIGNSRLVAICIVIFIICVSVLCFLTSLVANYKYKKTMKENPK